MTLPRYGRGPLWFCVYMVHKLTGYGMTLPRYGRGPLWFCVYMVHKLTGIWYDFA